jgi:hypothetical protein
MPQAAAAASTNLLIAAATSPCYEEGKATDDGRCLGMGLCPVPNHGIKAYKKHELVDSVLWTQ